MNRDITESVSRYLLGDKNLRRCLETVTTMYPASPEVVAGYTRGLQTLFSKYLARHSPIYGGREEGRQYIVRANDACVSKICRVIRSRLAPVRTPSPPPEPAPDDEIKRLLGYSMLHLYPLDRRTVEKAAVSSVIENGLDRN